MTGIVLLAACGGDGGTRQPTVVTSAAPSPTQALVGRNQPGAAVTAAVQACREKDTEQLRALIPPSVTDDEIVAMFARGTDVQLLSQSVPETISDSASIDVSLRITNESGESIVRRTWELERSGAVWRLTTLPDCY